MKYYIYISDAKVDMLLPQIPRAAKRKIATEFKIDLKVLSASRKAETDISEDRITRLEAVSSFIREYGNVGSIANPDAYIFDSMTLRMAILHYRYLYFGGQTENTILGLSGSVFHLLGHQNGPQLKGAFVTSSLLTGVVASMQSSSLSSSDNLNLYRATERANMSMKGLNVPEEKFEFLARRLLYEPADEQYRTHNLLLATPLYVSIND